MTVAMRKDHPLPQLGRAPRPKDVVAYPLDLLEPRFGGRQSTDMIARMERITLRPSMPANSYRLALAYVSCGQALFLMPYKPSPQRDMNEALTTMPLDYPSQITSHIQIITRRGRCHGAPVRDLPDPLIREGQFEEIAGTLG